MKYTEPLDRLSYSLGLSIAGSLLSSGIADINVQAFAAAVTAAYAGTTPDIAPDEAERIIQEHLRGIQAQQGAAAKAAGEKFLADNAKQEGVTTLPSGLQYKIITPAAGAIPALKDTVRCHYEGRLIDGTVFDSSYRRGTPAEFPVSGVIAGWVEALQMMPVGSKWQLYIPSALAYGEHGAGSSIGPNETLIFDIELIGIL
jgi:FKBP-type peptidyl-prolyl cis-trans isomerase FklB